MLLNFKQRSTLLAELLHVKGGNELSRALKGLPIKLEKKIMRAAMRQGANVIKDEAKLNAPIKSGKLRRSIRVSTNAKRGRVEAKVRAGNKKVFYTHFVEYGTAMHGIAAKDGRRLKFRNAFGQVVGATRVIHGGATAKPFMRPALDRKAGDAVNVTAKEIRQRLKRIVTT